jgi:serine/threonine protein kinase
MYFNNVLKILDLYEMEKKTYIVSELCESDLRKLLKEKGALSESLAIRIISQVIFGYAELFTKRIIHRDIKPANILLKVRNPNS